MPEQPSTLKLAVGVGTGIALAPFIVPVLVFGLALMIGLLEIMGSIIPDPRYVPHTIELRNVEMIRDSSGRPRVTGEVFNGDEREVRSLRARVDWLDAAGKIVSSSSRSVVQYKRLPRGGVQHFEIRGPRAHQHVRSVRFALDPHWFRWSPDPGTD